MHPCFVLLLLGGASLGVKVPQSYPPKEGSIVGVRDSRTGYFFPGRRGWTGPGFPGEVRHTPPPPSPPPAGQGRPRPALGRPWLALASPGWPRIQKSKIPKSTIWLTLDGIGPESTKIGIYRLYLDRRIPSEGLELFVGPKKKTDFFFLRF